MPHLTSADADRFVATGWLRLDGAVPREACARVRSLLWSIMGLSPDDPSGWTAPVVRLPFLAAPPFREAADTPALRAAWDLLAGEAGWQAPGGLGTFPVRFPSPDDPGDAGWHVDMSLDVDRPDFLDWRVAPDSEGRALLMLYLLSDTTEADAPTRLREGSHFDVARRLAQAGPEGLTLRALAATGFAESAHRPELLATGPAGTVYLCHPFLVHAAQPHRGPAPRFLAQPPLLPSGPGPLAGSAVARAIRAALA